jgi:hypothetical protein
MFVKRAIARYRSLKVGEGDSFAELGVVAKKVAISMRTTGRRTDVRRPGLISNQFSVILGERR